jgi:hypothetical protein
MKIKLKFPLMSFNASHIPRSSLKVNVHAIDITITNSEGCSGAGPHHGAPLSANNTGVEKIFRDPSTAALADFSSQASCFRLQGMKLSINLFIQLTSFIMDHFFIPQLFPYTTLR